MSTPQTPQEVKRRKNHPFSLAFSPRRMSQPGFDKPTPPQTPAQPRHTIPAKAERRTNQHKPIVQDKLTQSEKHDLLVKQVINDLHIDWYEGQLPSTWSPEDAAFFGNWRRELAGLHETILTVAADQRHVLKKAHKAYCRLAFSLRRILKWDTVRQ